MGHLITSWRIAAALLFVVCCFHTSQAEASFPHPVGFWLFDKIHEGKDLSGNGNDAVLYNTEWTSGPFGTPERAVKFTGADDQSSRAEIPNTNRALSVTNSFTWLTYFKDLNAGKEGPIWSLGNPATYGHIFWKCCNGGAAFHPRFDVPHNGDTAWSLATASFFPADLWMQVAVTYDRTAGVIRIYQYGEERVDLRASFSGQLDDQWDKVFVGAIPPETRELEAAVACTMYFGEALSREQIAAAFSVCRPHEAQSLYPWPAPIAHWPLNSFFGANNAVDGMDKDGVPKFFSPQKGPDGEPGGSYYFRNSLDSYVSIENADDKLDVNSFTFSAWIKPNGGDGPIFRIWNSDGNNNAPHIWKYPDGTQLYYAHYSDLGGGVKTSISTPSGSLKPNEWNYIAVVYDYGQGYSYLYINGDLGATGNHGSHPTKRGPTFTMIEYNSDTIYNRDSQLACVQWFGDPLSVYALNKIKNECNIAKKSYKPSPIWIFPFSKTNGLKGKIRPNNAAVTSGETSFIEGARKRPNEAILLGAGQTLTLPATATNDEIFSFSLTTHIKPSTDTDISLLGDIITFTHPNISVMLSGTTFTYSDIITDLVDEFFWLGVVYEGDLGILTIYIDGEPIRVDYIDHFSITLPELLVITNTAGETGLQCYQFYTEALNLRQFAFTRDACIVYDGPQSLPYPRGLWPMNEKYQFREITGRSPDMIPLDNSGITFDQVGPHGEPNTAAYFDKDINNATIYIPRHRGLDVKFSMTVSMWLKVHSTFPSDNSINVFSFRPIQDTDYSDRGDTDEAGVSIVMLPHANGLYIAIKTSTTNHYVTVPETVEGQGYYHWFQRDEWVHIAVVSDFHGKSTSLYLNGEHMETKRANRHILKTFYPVMVGGIVDFDLESVHSNPTVWNTDNTMSCVQLYDVALSEEQVKRSMDLCKTETLAGMYSKNSLVTEGESITNPDSTVTAKSQADCAITCRDDANCKSIGYGNSECDLTSSRREDLTAGSYSDKGNVYLEKDVTPWKLFV